MPEPTVDQVLNIDKQSQKPSPVALGAIVAFFLFAPLGVYLLWKEKTFHRIFALLTMILGIGYLVSSILTLPIGSHFILISFVVLLSGFQVFYSFLLYRKAKTRGYLEVSGLTVLAVLVLLIDFIVIPLLLSWIIFDVIWKIYLELLGQNNYYNLPIE